MMVCHCRAVNKRTVCELISEGCVDIEEIGERCGAGTDCGGCHPVLEELLATAMPVRVAVASGVRTLVAV